jgi:hypothetical protein
MARGHRMNLGTTARIALLIDEEFGVDYHPNHIARLLYRLNWGHQKPERWAIERDEQQNRAMDNSRTHLSKSYSASIHVCIWKTSPPTRRNSIPTIGFGLEPSETGRIAAPRTYMSSWKTVIRSINGIRRSSKKLRGCIRESEMPSFLHYLYVAQ